LKTFLESSPALLSREQLKKVEEALSSCEARLDDLQVDGLLAKFETLSEMAKQDFMKELRRY